jgi:hypothetical protein
MSDRVPPSAGQDNGDPAPSRGPRWSSDLHESLATSEASASQLRKELDDLRRSLDVPSPTRPAPRRWSSRPTVLGTGLGAILVLALSAGLAARAAGSGSAERSPAAATTSMSSTNSPSARASPWARSATPSATPVPTAASLPRWPGEAGPQPPGLPAHGVGADLPGSEMTAALGTDRKSIEVYQRALLAAAGPALTLRPATSDEVTRSLRTALPTVEELHVAIDGRPVPVTRTASGWSVPVTDTTMGPRLTLRYRLSGAVVRPEQAPRGRYTVVFTPLTPGAGSGADGRVVVRIRDPRVEEVYCPGTTNQLCGHRDGSLHVATVPVGTVPIVVGLVTFPS